MQGIIADYPRSKQGIPQGRVNDGGGVGVPMMIVGRPRLATEPSCSYHAIEPDHGLTGHSVSPFNGGMGSVFMGETRRRCRLGKWLGPFVV